MVPHLMELNALVIVNIEILFLSNSEHIFVLQEVDVTHKLLGLEFCNKIFVLPVKHSYMSLSRA